MAARVKKIQHDTKTKRLIQASQLLNLLAAHAKNEKEMTTSQVNAAIAVIKKSIPDLKAIEARVETVDKVEFVWGEDSNGDATGSDTLPAETVTG